MLRYTCLSDFHGDSKVLFSAPQHKDLIPTRRQNRFGVTGVAVISDRMRDVLSLEFNVRQLRRFDWRKQAERISPQLLIVESFFSASGGWSTPILGNQWQIDLLEIMEHYRSQGLPIVFLDTVGPSFSALFKAQMSAADAVWSIEPESLDRKLDVNLFAPAAQTALFHPFGVWPCKTNGERRNILFDGWSDLRFLRGTLEPLLQVDDAELRIIDSNFVQYKNRRDQEPKFQNQILGCVNLRAQAWHYRKASVVLDPPGENRNQTLREWMVMEALACGVPVITSGASHRLSDAPGVTQAKNDSDFCALTMASLEDQFEREKLSLLAFRFAAGSNSISHRVAQIFDTLGIIHSWQPTPKVSVITPSCRPEKIDNVVANFLRQTYEPLELLLVINCSLSEIERKTIESRLARSGIRKYRLYVLDGERFTGDAMNIGVWNAKGRYCAKFDDDDSYGPNYVRDLVLSAETVSADLAGKPISYRVVGFEDDDRVLVVKRGTKPYRAVVLWMDRRFSTPEWIMGNSIFARRDLLLRVGFPERAYRCSDSGFFFRPELAESRILVSDFFNLVVRRRSDKDTHTWRISDSDLLEGATARSIDEVFV